MSDYQTEKTRRKYSQWNANTIFFPSLLPIDCLYLIERLSVISVASADAADVFLPSLSIRDSDTYVQILGSY